MDRRFVAFLVTLLGAGAMLFGAMYGQGMEGTGPFFGAVGADTASIGAFIGMAAAGVTPVAAPLLMFTRHVRPLVILLLMASLVGTLAAGLMFGIGALLALAGGGIALTVDRESPLV